MPEETHQASQQNEPVRSIDQLKAEYDALNTRRIQTETQLESAQKDLAELEEEALTEFNTCDVDELHAKLELMESENEKKRREYQTLLDGINAALTKVEQEATSTAQPVDAADGDTDEAAHADG